MPSGDEEQERGSGGIRLEREPFTFTGTGREYFGIWIVNILLTILTLGIYSAWAKVRRTRYFYGNTRLAGASFDYHARPVQILIGRIVVGTTVNHCHCSISRRNSIFPARSDE